MIFKFKNYLFIFKKMYVKYSIKKKKNIMYIKYIIILVTIESTEMDFSSLILIKSNI